MSELPRILLVLEIEGRPRLRVEASDDDLARLVDWLADERVRAELDRLVALATGRGTSD